MANLNAHFRELGKQLGTLRDLLASSARSETYLKFFDEYLSVNEFELALHTLCDFLLEPTAPVVSSEVLHRVEVLHTMMQLHDDCLEKLKEKTAHFPGTINE